MKKLLSIALAFVMMLGMVVPVYADNNLNNEQHEISIMSGDIYEGEISFLNDSNSNVNMTNIRLDLDKELHISGNLEYNGTKQEITIKGDLYPFDSGVHEGNLVLGDLEIDSKEFKVINFRVFGKSRESDLLRKNRNLLNKSTITIAMEDLKTGNKIVLQSEIDKALFDNLLLNSRNYLKSLKLDEDARVKKLMYLYNYDKNINRSKIDVVEVQSEAVAEISSEIGIKGAPSVEHSELIRFIDDLNNKGKVKLSNYDIPSTFFTKSGWAHYSSFSSFPYFCYSCYSSKATDDFYVVQFSLVDIIRNCDSVGSNIKEASLQLMMNDGMVLEYTVHNDTVEVLHLKTGLKISNLQLAISKLRGNKNNIFIERDVNGQLRESNGSYVKALVGLVPYSKYLSAVWQFATMEVQTNAIGGNEVIFDNTVEKQKERYGGM